MIKGMRAVLVWQRRQLQLPLRPSFVIINEWWCSGCCGDCVYCGQQRQPGFCQNSSGVDVLHVFCGAPGCSARCKRLRLKPGATCPHYRQVWWRFAWRSVWWLIRRVGRRAVFWRLTRRLVKKLRAMPCRAVTATASVVVALEPGGSFASWRATQPVRCDGACLEQDRASAGFAGQARHA